jgi:hypothetical protein
MKTSMTSVEIDLDIYKLIQGYRQSFEETDNDILRRLLNLPDIEAKAKEPENQQEEGINLRHRVFLPKGTLLRSRYKGKEYEGEVKYNKIWVLGKGYNGPSPAAGAITSTSVNGWRFWEVKWPFEDKWILLDHLKKKR